ncbi:MurR/RpiR family transcriptional regulator [Nonomuraea gerenzanensis]|uniref:Transcriptional regulator, RpiR family n=1 Tax=Nonomuraea gerenzanensis TaxID=93944 RepID=A0A1M4ED14_9ACTN|nr:MurR/RpiR family transcriptional regulator [Nonomuraea gerenzanensis]UBU08278.1 MurR/RpiR family transcriptional regulator [Nonomuraea gerenzanensis]SBO96606.1 Transcriptional regulator, RpiR family [Nonomuraea gerenzanensis]
MENETIAARLGAVYPELPPGERAVVRVLLDDYPFAALGSLRALAERAGVSPPTASRLFDRLGFGGFAAFQAAVRHGARDRSQLLEHVAGPSGLGQAAEDLRAGLDGTLAAVPESLCQKAAELLAEARTVWALGGPLSELAAEYLIRQLASLRPGAHRVPGSVPARARTVLDLGPSDVVVAYDFRRYSPDTARFVRAAHERGARLVLVTDAWGSPLAAQAQLLISLPREASGPIAPLAHEIAVTELLLVATAGLLAPAARLADLDALTRSLS